MPPIFSYRGGNCPHYPSLLCAYHTALTQLPHPINLPNSVLLVRDSFFWPYFQAFAPSSLKLRRRRPTWLFECLAEGKVLSKEQMHSLSWRACSTLQHSGLAHLDSQYKKSPGDHSDLFPLNSQNSGSNCMCTNLVDHWMSLIMFVCVSCRSDNVPSAVTFNDDRVMTLNLRTAPDFLNTSGVNYSIRVFAENAVGVGVGSEPCPYMYTRTS